MQCRGICVLLLRAHKQYADGVRATVAGNGAACGGLLNDFKGIGLYKGPNVLLELLREGSHGDEDGGYT